MADRKIDVTFKKSKDYRRIAATGAWGGPTPNAHILCEFFIEALDEPESIKLNIKPDGTHEETERIGGQGYTRELQMGVILRPDVALAIGEWLVKHANNLLSIGKNKTIQ